MSEFYPLDKASFPSPLVSKKALNASVEARRLHSLPLDYRLDKKRRLEPGSSIDQGVALALTVRLGSISSAPNVGNTLHQVQIGTSSTDADVRDRVARAFPLSRYVSDGDVRIEDIRHEERVNGGLLVAVDYMNLRTNKAEKSTFGDDS